MLKKILSLILCVCALFCIFSTTASAVEIWDGKVTVGSSSGLPGETVVLPITFNGNPGVSAFIITIIYDSNALVYEDYYPGDFYKGVIVQNNTESKTVKLVFSSFSDVYEDGNIVSLKFKIKENTKMGSYKVRISTRKGDFANLKETIIVPQTIKGAVDVKYTGSNCPHKYYTEWQTVGLPSCEKEGIQQRYCEFCGHIQSRELAPTGHDFEKDWTIDLPATPKEQGLMSRHCKNCTVVTDAVKYTYKQSQSENIDNNINATVPESDFVDSLVEQQKPESNENKDYIDKDKIYYKEEKVPTKLVDKINYYLLEKGGMGIIGKIMSFVKNLENILNIFPIAFIHAFNLILV